MAKTVFVAGTVVSAAYLNAVNNPVFVDVADNDGEIAKITDADLTGTAGNIKPEWQGFRDGLKVTQNSGLVVNVAGGSIIKRDRTLVTISPTTKSVTNNATTFIWADNAGDIQTGASLPILAVPLASVVASAGSVSTITDLRSRELHRILPRIDRIQVFGGFGSTDKTCTNGEILSNGLYYFKNFTVPNGASITVSQFAKIICSGTVTIDGSITVTPAVQGGGSYNTHVPLKASSTGVVSGVGGIPGAGIGGGSGGSVGDGGKAYNWLLQPYGSGGCSGFVGFTGAADVAIPAGGSGGGGFWIEAAEAISINGTITADGQAGANSSTSEANSALTGGAGGSGGTVVLMSAVSITVGNGLGSIFCRGGNGGNGFRGAGADAAAGGNASEGGGGGPGGGGQIVLVAPTVTTSGSTLNVNTGSIGTSSGIIGSTARAPRGGGNGGTGGTRGGGAAAGIITVINELPV